MITRSQTDSLLDSLAALAFSFSSIAQSQRAEAEALQAIARALSPKGIPRVVSVTQAKYAREEPTEAEPRGEVPGFRKR